MTRTTAMCDPLNRRQALGAAGGLRRHPPRRWRRTRVTSDPRSFSVVLENDRVRVLEYKSRPGLGVCGQGMHSHPAM